MQDYGDAGGEDEDSDDEELPGLEDKDSSAAGEKEETGLAGEGGKSGAEELAEKEEDKAGKA